MFNFSLVLITIYFIFSVLSSITDSIKGEEIATAYIKSCLGYIGQNYNISNCEKEGGKIYFDKEEFRVDFKNQLVIENSYDALKLKNCTVFDKENWACKGYEGNNQDAFIAMHNGKITSSFFLYTLNNKEFAQKVDAPAIEYWIYTIKNFIPS